MSIEIRAVDGSEFYSWTGRAALNCRPKDAVKTTRIVTQNEGSIRIGSDPDTVTHAIFCDILAIEMWAANPYRDSGIVRNLIEPSNPTKIKPNEEHESAGFIFTGLATMITGLIEFDD